MTFQGLVLAGGSSRRFGSDKTGAILDGQTLLENARRRLVQAGVEVWTSRGGPSEDAEVVDIFPDAGPLGGIHAGLHKLAPLPDARLVVLASDLPYISPETIRRLMDQSAMEASESSEPSEPSESTEPSEPSESTEPWEPAKAADQEAPIIVCEGQPSGRIQPLCGISPVQLLFRLEQWLSGGGRSVMGFISEVGFQRVGVSDDELLNVNRPEDLPLRTR